MRLVLVFQLFALVLASVCLCWLIRIFLFKTGLIFAVKKWWRRLEDCFHVYQSLRVPEFNENLQENQLYSTVSAYLNSLAAIEDSDFTNLVTGKKPNDIVLCLDPKQRIEDDFLGAKVLWIKEEKNQVNSCRNFVLKIRKADKRRILRPYLQHIHTVTADEIEPKKRELKLYVNVSQNMNAVSKESRLWKSVPFTHPSTFETIAMEVDLKDRVKSDLELFLKSKQYYHRLGRVWKRSFLLYGPSGTGKSSFVSAMANFLSYDVYNVDFSNISSDSELKFLLLQTTAKSIILLEDLDRINFEKSKSVSLSGLLNFMDGILTSCCADERVMVFTINSKENVDPVVLRPGRIDVHIQFNLCDFSAFKNLAHSYLGVKDHKLFPQVEEIFQTGASLSPAEIGELMITNRSSPSRAIKSVISALQTDVDRRVVRKSHVESRSRKIVEEPVEPGGLLCNEKSSPGKELKKFYGFLRMKSSNKVQSSDDISSPSFKE